MRRVLIGLAVIAVIASTAWRGTLATRSAGPVGGVRRSSGDGGVTALRPAWEAFLEGPGQCEGQGPAIVEGHAGNVRAGRERGDSGRCRPAIELPHQGRDTLVEAL